MTLATAANLTLQAAAPSLSVFGMGSVHFSQQALTQARAMTQLPDVVHALAMPDLHAGVSVPNGFVLSTRSSVIPAAVGKDINCGMRLMTTNLTRQDVTRDLLADIYAAINIGERWSHVKLSEADTHMIMQGGLATLADISMETRSQHAVWEMIDAAYLQWELAHVEERGSLTGDPSKVARAHIKQGGMRQLGTLGSGNHFLEFQVIDDVLNTEIASALGIMRGAVVMMLHSGSRGMGHNIANQYGQKARNLGNGPINAKLKDVHPIPVDSELGQDYLGAAAAASNWGYANRMMLGALALHTMRTHYNDAEARVVYDISHNMVKPEEHGGESLFVHRKGAARALPPSKMIGTEQAAWGQPVIIPGSMGTASYLLVGVEGSEAALHSVNHGAGRVLSRSQALGFEVHDDVRRGDGSGRLEVSRKRISKKEFKRAMRGVTLVNHDNRTIIGEAPQAYKDIDGVIGVVDREGMAAPVARMRPIGVIKE